MTIEQLVEELKNPKYRDDEKKVELLKKHLKTDYLPYEMKINSCRKILETARYKTVNGKKIYSPNGTTEYYIKIVSIIQLYYDIEMRDGEDRNEDFNLLEKNDITELLIKAIPSKEIERLATVHNILAEDMVYEASIVPFLENKFEAIDIVFDRMLKMFDIEKMKALVEKKLNEENETNNKTKA